MFPVCILEQISEQKKIVETILFYFGQSIVNSTVIEISYQFKKLLYAGQAVCQLGREKLLPHQKKDLFSIFVQIITY